MGFKLVFNKKNKIDCVTGFNSIGLMNGIINDGK